MTYSTVTLTFSKCVENNIGNQQIGELAHSGYSIDFLRSLTDGHSDITLHDLSYEGYEAGILIIKDGVDRLLYLHAADDLLDEQDILTPDKKYWDRRRKKVLNKRARHNLCFADFDQDAEYEEGKGTVINFETQPILSSLRDEIGFLTEDILFAEGNYYHEYGQTGIGFHGDTERRKVVGVRLGRPMPLVYRWYDNCKFTGIEYRFDLEHGDIYIMSDKAVGFDWRRRVLPTLRHAAGTTKYISPKAKKKQIRTYVHDETNTANREYDGVHD